MKKLAAALAAALIAVSVSTPVLAAPEDEEDTSAAVSDTEESAEDFSEESQEDSDNQENQENSEDNSENIENNEDNEDTEETSESPEEENSLQQESSSLESSSESSAEDTIEQSPMKYYFIESIDMSMGIPENMHVLSLDINEDDPALAACKITKEEMVKSFKESNTYIKASAKDFSYDITVTLLQNDSTETIGDLTALSNNDVEKVIKSLLEQKIYTGCARNKYNDTLYLTLDMVYENGDAKVYGIQQYTIVNNTKVVISFQSYTGEVTAAQRELLSEIMKSVVFKTHSKPPVTYDVNETNVQNLDPRYFCILAASVIGIAALAGMIISASKYKHSKNKNQDSEDKNDPPENKGNKLTADNFPDIITEKDKPEENYTDSYFKPINENVIYEDKSVQEEREKREQTRVIPRLDSASKELEIPENPYTPVGKAEAVAQPAMSLTSEFTKLTVNTSSMEAVAEEKENDAEEDEVVFAESSPKSKTEIQQIGESVIKNSKIEEISENKSAYEQRFGKNRNENRNSNIPQEDNSSKFEKRFGKPELHNSENTSNNQTANTLTYDSVSNSTYTPPVNTLTYDSVSNSTYTPPVNTLTYDSVSNDEDSGKKKILTEESESQNPDKEPKDTINFDSDKKKDDSVIDDSDKQSSEEEQISEPVPDENVTFEEIAGAVDDEPTESPESDLKSEEKESAEQKTETADIGIPIAINKPDEESEPEEETQSKTGIFDKIKEKIFSYDEEDIELDDDEDYDTPTVEEKNNNSFWAKIKNHLKYQGEKDYYKDWNSQQKGSEEQNSYVAAKENNSVEESSTDIKKPVSLNKDTYKKQSETTPWINPDTAKTADNGISKYDKLFGHKNNSGEKTLSEDNKNEISDEQNKSAFEKKFGKVKNIPVQNNTVEAKSEDKTETVEDKSKTEETKSENKTETVEDKSKTEETKSENKTETVEDKSKTEETKFENKTETVEDKSKTEEAKFKDKIETVEDKSKTEEAKFEDKTETVEDKSKTEEAKSENKTETVEDKSKTEETKSEDKTETVEDKSKTEEAKSKDKTETVEDKSKTEEAKSKDKTETVEDKSKTEEVKSKDKTETVEDKSTTGEVKSEDKDKSKTEINSKNKNKTIKNKSKNKKKHSKDKSDKETKSAEKSDKDKKATDKNIITETKAEAMENNNRNQYILERDSNIKFEHAVKADTPLEKSVTPLTSIPRLESVNADEYNSMIDGIIHSQKNARSYNNRFGSPKIPDKTAPANVTKPVHSEPKSNSQPAQPKPSVKKETSKPKDDSIEYYKGYDPDDDPFRNEKYKTEEMIIKEQKKQKSGNIGEKLKSSFAKLFSSDEDESS